MNTNKNQKVDNIKLAYVKDSMKITHISYSIKLFVKTKDIKKSSSIFQKSLKYKNSVSKR